MMPIEWSKTGLSDHTEFKSECYYYSQQYYIDMRYYSLINI